MNSKIIRLQAENVKRITAIDITPDGGMVVVGGSNGAGKTSVLDSIMYALGGASTIPSKPLRNGAKSGKVEIDLGELKVTRTFTKTGGTLKVTGADGEPAKSPQGLLDALVGRLAFDPLEFSRMKPAAQRETLVELVGLDVSEFDKKAKALAEERLELGREGRVLAGAFERAPHYPDAPAEEVSAAEIAAEVDAARAQNLANDKARAELRQARTDLDAKRAQRDRSVAAADATDRRLRATVADLEHQLTMARDQIDEQADECGRMIDSAQAQVVVADQAVERQTERVESLLDVDERPLRARLVAVGDENAKVRANAARAQTQRELAESRTAYSKLNQAVERVEEEKRAAIEAAEYPLPGLAVDDDGVTLDGVPWDQASHAQQLRASVAIGLKLNPKLRVLLVRDGSLLDEGGMKAIAEMATEHDAQVWIERVGVGAETSVVIVDGEVRK